MAPIKIDTCDPLLIAARNVQVDFTTRIRNHFGQVSGLEIKNKRVLYFVHSLIVYRTGRLTCVRQSDLKPRSVKQHPYAVAKGTVS